MPSSNLACNGEDVEKIMLSPWDISRITSGPQGGIVSDVLQVLLGDINRTPIGKYQMDTKSHTYGRVYLVERNLSNDCRMLVLFSY